MQTIRTYSTRLEADVARIALEAAGLQSVVAGMEAAMEGGTQGVALMVLDEDAKAALEVLSRTG